MAIKSEKIMGKKILVEMESSNLRSAEYSTDSKELIMEFKNGVKYQYADVPWEIFTKLRMSESQGKFFNKEIARTYEYKKIEEDES